MKKPEKNNKKKLASIKRGLKRSLRLKASRAKVVSQRKKIFEARKKQKLKMDELVNTLMQSRGNSFAV